LMRRGQEAGAPQLRTDVRHSRTHGDKTRQVLILRAQSVGEPEPIDGKPGMMCPELICRIACGCDGRSVYIERITQTSSIHAPTYGNRSLTSTPLLPYFLKTNG